MEFKKKTRFSDASRNKNILQGATAIITQWPGRWTACWATSLCLGVLILLMTILISFSLQDFNQSHSKCPIKPLPLRFSNRTLHIVHSGSNWNQKELNLLKFIVDTYANYTFHISIFKNDSDIEMTSTMSTKKMVDTTTSLTTEKQSNENSLLFYDGPLQSFDPFSLLEKFRNLKPMKRVRREVPMVPEGNMSFKAITNASNIFVDYYFYGDYFNSTPLKHHWVNLSEENLLFACRVQELWQHSGISFLIPKYGDNKTAAILNNKNESAILNNTTNLNIENNQTQTDMELKNLISNSKSVFEGLSPDLVIIDRKGYHVGSKIPCHAFFGELMSKITKNTSSTIQSLIEDTLREFCKRNAVNPEDCKLI